MNSKAGVMFAASMALIGLSFPVTAVAQDRAMRRQEVPRAALPERAPTKSLSYGSATVQAVDYWRARPKISAPLIIFVHGGGWQRGSKESVARSWKLMHYHGSGYNVAAVGYRLYPEATVEEQAGDIAKAIAALRNQASNLGIDPARIVLMGHSAGAHLVSLVGTDPRYLQQAGLTPSALRGVVAIDGAAYDVPRQMREGPPLMQTTYRNIFGTETARQEALSPVMQAHVPNVGHFLILHVQRPDGIAQSNALAAALKRAGTNTETISVPGMGLAGHAEINRRLGDPSYPLTAQVDAWLGQLLGKSSARQ